MTHQRAAAPSAGPSPHAAGPGSAPPAILTPRLLGNRAVGQLAAAERTGSLPRALGPGLRTSLETRFGHDLGSVRIHTGPAASALAARHRAKALAVGEHIVFRGNGYAPDTVSGRRSIAHEVAHVLQQRRGGPADGEPALESDAEAAARAFVAHPTGRIRVRASSPVRVSRQAEGVEAAEPDDSLGWVEVVVEALTRQVPLGLAGPMSGLMAAAVRGFVAELIKQVSGTDRLALVAELRKLDVLDFAAGYAAGALAGLLSPITDLVGLVDLARRLPEMIGQVLARGYLQREEILTEVDAIATGMRKWLAGLGEQLADLDATSIQAMLAVLDKRARKAAASVGHAAARELVKGLTGGGDAAKESWASGLFVGNRSRERGYNIGHLVGAVVSNLVIFVLTDGVGDAILQIAGRLGKLGGMIGKSAKLVEAIGETVLMVERAIGALTGAVLKPFAKLLEPLVELMGRLRSVLRRLFGVEKAAATAAGEAAAKTAAAAAKPPAAKPPPKRRGAAPPESEPRIRVAQPEPEPKVRVDTEPAPGEEVFPDSVGQPVPPRAVSTLEAPPVRPEASAPAPTPIPAPSQPAPAPASASSQPAEPPRTVPPRAGGPGGGPPGPPGRRTWVHPENAKRGQYQPLPEDVPVQYGPGSGLSEGEALTSYADAMRTTAQKNPATAAVGGGSGPYIRDNLYSGKRMTRVVNRLTDEGILAVSPSGKTLRVVDPDRYMGWLERSYRQHGQAHLDRRMRDAIRGYVGRGQPLGAVATDPLTGASSFAGALPGTHAEVLALNDLLASGRASSLAHVTTVRARNGAHFVACAHCTGIINRLPPEVSTAVWSGKVVDMRAE